MSTIRLPASGVVVATAIVAACATSRASPPTNAANTPSLEQLMPQQVGKFRMVKREVLRPAGTGTIYRFRDSSKVNLSVILYEVTADAISHTPDPVARVQDEGSVFLQILPIQLRRGFYTAYTMIVARPDSIIVGQRVIPGFLAAASVLRSGRKSYEIEYLHMIDNMFVKTRVSIPELEWPRLDLTSFVESLVTSLVPPPKSESRQSQSRDATLQR